MPARNATVDHEKSIELETLARSIVTKDEFVAFLQKLYSDFLYEGDEWQSQTLESFLRALTTYFDSTALPDEIGWSTFAEGILWVRFH